MTLQERINYLTYVFDLLQDTNSRNEKEFIVSNIPDSIKEDFLYIVECLNGKHVFGYKYYRTKTRNEPKLFDDLTVKGLLEFLQKPREQGDLSKENIEAYVSMTNVWYFFLEPIVNRTLKLGIGNSLIEKTDVSPMLARKFEGQHLVDDKGIFITEKLDGNRCIAQWTGDKWTFTSRNGKEMYVNFDMTGLDKSRIYDGEVMNRLQTVNSIRRTKGLGDISINTGFNEASGLINRHTTNKDLVYNIFDIVDKDLKYYQRRDELNSLSLLQPDVRVLPVLQIGLDGITDRLDYIVKTGGEGLMINLGSAQYQQKRTNDLLKFKQVQTMDMRVVDWEYGTGKYTSCLGYIVCEGDYKGNKISCKVGTGITDEQRVEWSINPDAILGKIVEVAYFSLSQNSTTIGTNIYSLRFPRLVKLRTDKNESSEY